MKLPLVSFVAMGALLTPLPLLAAQDDPAPGDAAVLPQPTPPALTPAPAPAHSATYVPRSETDSPRAYAPPRYDYLRFGLGARVGYIDSPGLDAFADNDVLAQMSLEASYAFLTKGKFALSVGAAWDMGSRTSGARGLDTRLTVHRLTVPVEAQWHFNPWFYTFAKVAPGTAAYYARIKDPSSPETLEDTPWVVAADLSGGAAFRVIGSNDHSERSVRLWVTSEIGYGLTGSSSIRPSPDRDEAEVLGVDARTRLAPLAVNGVFWRTGLALTF